MAFTGVATIVQVSDGICRITGLSLAAAAAGTISLSGGTGQQKLPAAFAPQNYQFDGVTVSFADALEVSVQNNGVEAHAPEIHLTKTGTGPTDWVATITNDDGANATPNLEIYVKFHT